MTPEATNAIKNAQIAHQEVDDSEVGDIDNRGIIDKNTPFAPK